ncbi:hypothetical protein AKJ16_DCAP13039 [Drosera capensis]
MMAYFPKSLTFTEWSSSLIRTLEANLTLIEMKARDARARMARVEHELEVVKGSVSELEAKMAARAIKVSEWNNQLDTQISRAEKDEKTLDGVRVEEVRKLRDSNFIGFNVGCEFTFRQVFDLETRNEGNSSFSNSKPEFSVLDRSLLRPRRRRWMKRKPLPKLSTRAIV